MFTGCGTALVTPFRSDLSLDEAGLRKLVERQIGAGIDFLVPCGTTGESPTLSGEEHLRVVEITVETAKAGGRKVPVLAGAGGYNTRDVIELAREVEARGADGILSVTPYYNKPTQEGLYQHYKALAAATRLPVVIYSVQGRTGVNVEVATLERLSALPNIAGVKEASGSVTQIGRVIRQLPESFLVLSGDDSITLPVMALGGHGIISVVSNEAPAMMTNLARLCAAGRFAEARTLHERHLDLMDVNFVESNPGPVKAAMALMGLLELHYRLPMVAPKPENLAKIETVLRNLNMIPAVAVAWTKHAKRD